jgi:metal-sulfur cluster biosynthetic enzyme
MSVGREQVMEALRAVPEPCSISMRAPMDITEMGLIEEVEIDGPRVAVTLVLTDPSCVHFSAMQRYIRDELLALDGVEDVSVTASVRSLWTPDRISRRPPGSRLAVSACRTT